MEPIAASSGSSRLRVQKPIRPSSSTQESALAIFFLSFAVTTFSPKLVPSVLLDSIMVAYAKAGFFDDAIQRFCFARGHFMPVPLSACSLVFHRLPAADDSRAFLMEIAKAGFCVKIQNFYGLIHRFYKEGKLGDARQVFDEIPDHGCDIRFKRLALLFSGFVRRKEGEKLVS